jgi:hypothetical protein
MKKFIVLSLCGLLIMAFAVTAHAIDFKVSGFIDAIGVWDENVPRYNAGAGVFQVVNPDYGYPFKATTNNDPQALDKKQTFWTTRARFKFDTIIDKNLSGTLFLEMDSTRWGDISGGNGSGIGGNAGGGLRESGRLGVWSTDRVAVEVKNLYIDFGLPYIGIPVPMAFRVGAQPLSIRPNILVYTDGMGIASSLDLSPVKLQYLFFKALEGKDWSADDVNVHALQANVKISTFTIGGYGLFYNMQSYPITAPLALTDSGGDTLPASLAGLQPGTNSGKMWWFGVFADGKLGPVNINFDVIYDTGKVKPSQNSAGVVPNVDYDGLMGYLKIDYPWEKFNFGAVGMYASGADTKKTSASMLPGTEVAYYGAGSGIYSHTVKSFVVPPGSEAGPIFGEALVVYNGFHGDSDPLGIATNANYNQLSRGATGGTAFIKAYGSVKPTPWYKATLQGLYVWDTTKNGNTFGNAVTAGVSPSGLVSRNDKSIGFELDLINEIAIYKNLTWYVGGGYLWAGSALDLRQVGTPLNFSPKNPWVLATKLLFSF